MQKSESIDFRRNSAQNVDLWGDRSTHRVRSAIEPLRAEARHREGV